MSEMRRIRNQILQKLYLGNISVYELIDGQDASLKEFFELIQILEKDGLISIENGMVSLKFLLDGFCFLLGLLSFRYLTNRQSKGNFLMLM